MIQATAGATIGPVVHRECGFCEGDGAVHREDGRSPCPACDGSGRVAVQVHPFVTLEALYENLIAIRTCMGLRRTEAFTPKVGTPAYYVDAVEDYAQSLFQQLVVMLPEEHRRTEGE